MDSFERGASHVLERMVDLVSRAYPTAPANLPSNPQRPRATSSPSKPPRRRLVLVDPPAINNGAIASRKRASSSKEEIINSTPSIITTLAKRLATNCYLCSNSSVMYQAVNGEEMIYLCSRGCLSRLKLSRKNYRKTTCIQCHERLDLSSLSFRPIFGFTDRSCCSETCYDNYNYLKSPKFMCRYQGCPSTVEKTSFRWQTMEFCKINCLSIVLTTVGSKCSQCEGPVPSPGQFCSRYGILLKHFCSLFCSKSYNRKNDRRCPACNSCVRQNDPSSDLGEYCSSFCRGLARKKKCILASMREHDQPGEFCDMCQCFTPLDTIAARFFNYQFLPRDTENYSFLCSTKCTAAYRHHHRIAQNLCTVCGRWDWPGTGLFYRSGASDYFIFCGSPCLSIYLASTKNYTICDHCGRQKVIFNAIEQFNLKNGSAKHFCSLQCCALILESEGLLRDNPAKLAVIKCAHCGCISRSGIHQLRPSDRQIISFCSASCQMQGESPPIVLPTLPIRSERIPSPPPPPPRSITPEEEISTPQAETPISASQSTPQAYSPSESQVATNSITTTTTVPSASASAPMSQTTTAPSPIEATLANKNTTLRLLLDTPVLMSNRALGSAPAIQAPTIPAAAPTQSCPCATNHAQINGPPPVARSLSQPIPHSTAGAFPPPIRYPQPNQPLNGPPLRLVSSNQLMTNRLSHFVNLPVGSTSHSQSNTPIAFQNGDLSHSQPSGPLFASNATLMRYPVRLVSQAQQSALPASSPFVTYLPINADHLSVPVRAPALPYQPGLAGASSMPLSSGVYSSYAPTHIPPFPHVAVNSAQPSQVTSQATSQVTPQVTPQMSSNSTPIPPSNHNLILLRERPEPKQQRNVATQATPEMISRAVMCKPLSESLRQRPVMVSIETQTEHTNSDEEIMIIEPPVMVSKSVQNGRISSIETK